MSNTDAQPQPDNINENGNMAAGAREVKDLIVGGKVSEVRDRLTEDFACMPKGDFQNFIAAVNQNLQEERKKVDEDFGHLEILDPEKRPLDDTRVRLVKDGWLGSLKGYDVVKDNYLRSGHFTCQPGYGGRDGQHKPFPREMKKWVSPTAEKQALPRHDDVSLSISPLAYFVGLSLARKYGK